MAVLIGQSIDGREVEQATSSWPPERFASMCDALSWATSGRSCASLPSFTSRVNAKDGGKDVEWSVEIPSNGSAIPTPIIGPGWNVFQYKKRDLLADDRQKIISTLKSSLKKAIKNVEEENKKCPDRYVLFVNVDLKGSDKTALAKAILNDSPNSNVGVEIIGAGELAALLNNHPHLRAAYFTPLLFKTWGVAYQDHRVQKPFAPSIDLVGREGDLRRLKALIDDPHIRAIVLSGPHDVGNSRLVLEATRHRPHDTVLALDPRSMDLKDYRTLHPNRGETLCIIEDPEPDSVEDLLNEALVASHFKIIATLPTLAHASVPSYGRDQRVQSLLLNPLASEDARKLLGAAGQPLDLEIEDWILRHAGGIPGVLLAAASVGNNIRTEFSNFAEAIGREFEMRIERELGPEVLTGARLLSVLTHVGVAGAAEKELRHICELFGEGATPNSVFLSLAKLERAGLAKHGGSFAEITLPLLANHLVTQLLRGRRIEMFALFSSLGERGQLRFLRRLSEIQSEEAARFWDEMFAADGLFSDWQTVLTNLHFLRIVAGTVPEHVLRLLEQGLLNSTREERLAIAGNDRRELMLALEELLFRQITSRGSARLIWLLAEAENELDGRNATGVLTECFYSLHLQMPLTLRQRMTLFSEILSEGASRETKLVMIKVAKAALWQGSGGLGRRSSGPQPLERSPLFTYEEIHNYYRFLVKLLLRLAKEESEVGIAALRELPEALKELGSSADPQEALEHFRTLVDLVCTGREGPRSGFLDGRKNQITQILSDPSTPTEVCTWLRKILSRLESEIPRQLVWEYDMGVDELRHHVQDKNSPQRMWAIGRILKYAEWKDLNRLLSVEDLAEALPLVDLPDKRRRMFERAVKVWQHEQ